MVFQEGALFDSLSVRDNVAYQLIQEQVPDDEIDAASTRRSPSSSSTAPSTSSRQPLRGMRRRVAIARASSASRAAALRLAYRGLDPSPPPHH